MAFISTDVTAIPTEPQAMRTYIEKILRDHFEDLKQIRNQLVLDAWRIIQDEDTGNLKIQEFYDDVWNDSGWELVRST